MIVPLAYAALAHVAIGGVLGLSAAAAYLQDRHRHGAFRPRPLHTLQVWTRPARRRWWRLWWRIAGTSRTAQQPGRPGHAGPVAI